MQRSEVTYLFTPVCLSVCSDIHWLFVGLFKTPNETMSQHYVKGHLYINKTLTVSAVSEEHSGTYTCTGDNVAGVATATTKLRLLGKKYR